MIVTRRQFVAGVSAASLGLLAAPAFGAIAASVAEPGLSPIAVRVGRLMHSGRDFRDGTARGVAVPSQGGNGEALRGTEPMAEFLSRPLQLEFPATHAGLHWTIDGELSQLDVALRFSADGLAWSSWRPLIQEHHERTAKGETFSTLVGLRGARWVQYRLTFGDAPGAGAVSAVGVAYLNAGVSRARPDHQTFSARLGPSSLLDQVITREQWGADESIRFSEGKDLWPRAFVAPRLLVVHHTATDNEYADPAAEVRAIYTYHTVIQGFGDIGYHMLIDNRGQIYEGRRGREQDAEKPGQREIVSANVVAGHVLGFNYGSAGIALLGTFTDEAPGDAALAALTQALAFEAHRAGLDPTAQTNVHRMRGTMPEDIHWRDGLSMISGHRDCIETECPGEQLYARLPRLRQATAALLDPAGPSARLTQMPRARNVWPEDLHFAWEAAAGAVEFSTRFEGFKLSKTPDLIVPLSGYTEDEREEWSEWSTAREMSAALDPRETGSYTLMIRARDGRGQAGRIYERRTYLVGPYVLADSDDPDATRRLGAWQRVMQPMNFHGSGYELGRPGAVFTWSMRPPIAGAYRIEACWTSGDDRTSRARYTLRVNDAPRLSVTVSQQERGGTWTDLGQVVLDNHEVCEIELSTDDDGTLAADAVRLVLLDA